MKNVIYISITLKTVFFFVINHSHLCDVFIYKQRQTLLEIGTTIFQYWFKDL